MTDGVDQSVIPHGACTVPAFPLELQEENKHLISVLDIVRARLWCYCIVDYSVNICELRVSSMLVLIFMWWTE